jgi:hypothetical protein
MHRGGAAGLEEKDAKRRAEFRSGRDLLWERAEPTPPSLVVD